MTLRHWLRVFHNPTSAVTRQWTRARQYVPGTIACVSTQDPVAALTFDDGPHPEYTPRVLDILQRYQAQATFFMVGEAAQKYTKLVQEAASAGHAIGNHSWDHPSFPSQPGPKRREQLYACERAIAPYSQRLFRPPYGAQSLASRLDALWLRYQVIAWSVDAKDWREHDAGWMADRLAAGIRPGSIVLLHDAIYRSRQSVPQYNREPMLAALTLFLERLAGRFRFVTVPELLRHGRPQGPMPGDPSSRNSSPSM